MIDNVVIYNNTIHDNGNVNANTDQDVHGISVTDHVNHLWVVDNQLYRNSGDGIQIVRRPAQQAATTHHIYVGRNVAHHNKQTGFWVKQATDVIFSQNVSYGHRPSNSSMGQCMGGQYAPDWVWFLYNRLYDCEYGIALMSDDGEPSHTFVIGNVIHNIHRTVVGQQRRRCVGPGGDHDVGRRRAARRQQHDLRRGLRREHRDVGRLARPRRQHHRQRHADRRRAT